MIKAANKFTPTAKPLTPLRAKAVAALKDTQKNTKFGHRLIFMFSPLVHDFHGYLIPNP